ncbi:MULTISPECIES: AzlD domain-containing protein [Janibacter]|uniref:AzlD domain-containing protein n=1 Tax=Janibacter melonis TaxID=262209 RepID=A0A5P8FKS6_9MICO|nr:AzlD domain-containing protein [Janibacter melonis]MCB5992999.1 AzlD domain-containing protein [Janibacter melonis]QFQ29878.1 AzlD domain-containing protein [Janibacter melonis]
MSAWATVLLAAVLGYALKLAGYLAPPSLVEGPRRSRVITLLPVALLAGLLVVQTAGGADTLTLDARLPAVVVAVALFALRVNFLLVVLAAAATAAGLRALGWAA